MNSPLDPMRLMSDFLFSDERLPFSLPGWGCGSRWVLLLVSLWAGWLVNPTVSRADEPAESTLHPLAPLSETGSLLFDSVMAAEPPRLLPVDVLPVDYRVEASTGPTGTLGRVANPFDPVVEPSPPAVISPPPIASVCQTCGDLRLSPRELFRRDVRGLLPDLAADAGSLLTWENAAILGVGLTGAIALRFDADDEVRQYTLEHERRWGEGSRILGHLGDAKYQVPVLAALYGWSLTSGDDDFHDLTLRLIRGYTLVGLSTTLIKGVANTERPSDSWMSGQYGFPSHHTASAFCISAILDDEYGPAVGVPAYVLSGLIGWSRIDDRDHDLSDVVFGAVVGYVIGRAVSRRRHANARWTVAPFVHPDRATTGLMVGVAF